LFTDPNEKVFLTMDRTNWQYGTKDINILMVGAVYKGIAIPIVWEILDKRGNSNTAERINIINRIISYHSLSLRGVEISCRFKKLL
jgi:hypothetical protein